MGSFFTDTLSFQHETAVFDVNPHQLRFVYNTYRFTTLEEIKELRGQRIHLNGSKSSMKKAVSVMSRHSPCSDPHLPA